MMVTGLRARRQEKELIIRLVPVFTKDYGKTTCGMDAELTTAKTVQSYTLPGVVERNRVLEILSCPMGHFM